MSRPARKVLKGSQLESTVNYGGYITQNETKSVLTNTDWFEEIDYAPENVICEVLEENEYNDSDISAYRNFDIDFDESSFSIWADL